MKRLLLLLLLLPLVAGENLISGEFTFVDEHNESYHFFINNTSETIICNESSSIEEHPCENMSIVGIPEIIESGEQFSYSFSPWADGDSVTYWIEDVRGEVVKDAYTTTSKSKKSYTPRVEGEERVLFVKAERERDGCPLSGDSVPVIVLGEAVVCEDIICEVPEPEVIIEECSFEQPVQSLYVRASNWQEDITLYGRAVPGEYWLFGEETPQRIFLNDSFSLVIHPVPGENKYGLVSVAGSEPIVTSFNLSSPETPQETAQEPVVNASYSFPATGAVVLENETGKNTSIIAGLTGVTGAGLLLSWLKAKRLRRKADSKAA